MTAKKKEKAPEVDLAEFVLANEEKILEILKAKEAEAESEVEDELNKVESKIKEEKEKGKALVKGVVEAITDREVTEHFMSMGIEFMLGIGALVKALPWPEEMKPFVDMVGEQKDALSSVMCRNNPNCGAKQKELPSPALERIELD